MHWIFLLLASAMEICWLYSLKYLDFGKIKAIKLTELTEWTPWAALAPLVGYIAFGVLNVFCFSKATSATDVNAISLSTGFAVWMGLALVGAKVLDIAVFGEAWSYKQLAFLVLVLIGIIGLKTSTP